jgi:hypothetical protein
MPRLPYAEIVGIVMLVRIVMHGWLNIGAKTLWPAINAGVYAMCPINAKNVEKLTV